MWYPVDNKVKKKVPPLYLTHIHLPQMNVWLIRRQFGGDPWDFLEFLPPAPSQATSATSQGFEPFSAYLTFQCGHIVKLEMGSKSFKQKMY